MLTPKSWIGVICVTTLLALPGIACGDGDGGDSAAEVEQTIRELAATGPEDVDFFLARVTDAFLEDFTGYTREECRQPDNVEECVGEPSESATVENVKVDGNTAEADLTLTDSEGEEFVLHLGLVQQDGVWKLDSFSQPAVEIPQGVKTVEVAGIEYAFEYDASQITDGNIAFAFSNEGEEEHELVVAKVTEEFDIKSIQGDEPEEESADEEALPPGIEEFSGFTSAGPGESANVVFEDGLAPGRYIMLCSLHDPDGTSHDRLGMYSEFRIAE